jgi:hypothetical protein
MRADVFPPGRLARPLAPVPISFPGTWMGRQMDFRRPVVLRGGSLASHSPSILRGCCQTHLFMTEARCHPEGAPHLTVITTNACARPKDLCRVARCPALGSRSGPSVGRVRSFGRRQNLVRKQVVEQRLPQEVNALDGLATPSEGGAALHPVEMMYSGAGRRNLPAEPSGGISGSRSSLARRFFRDDMHAVRSLTVLAGWMKRPHDGGAFPRQPGSRRFTRSRIRLMWRPGSARFGDGKG